jgi:DNA-binding XRE family transcriptional regulator
MLTSEQIDLLRHEPLDGANKVRRARELAGLTQIQVAREVPISQPYLSAIETGKSTDLTLETSRSLAMFFGVQIEDLFPARQEVAS